MCTRPVPRRRDAPEAWKSTGRAGIYMPDPNWTPEADTGSAGGVFGNFVQGGVEHFRQQKARPQQAPKQQVIRMPAPAAPPPPPDGQGERAGEVLRGGHSGAGSGRVGRNSRRTGRTGDTMLTARPSGGGGSLLGS